MAHYKAVNKKHLVLGTILVVVTLFITGFICYRVGYKQSTKDGQEPMESEIRLVQEHTAEAVTNMFFNIPEVREAMNNRKEEIYSVNIYWWNFDRQFELVRLRDNVYNTNWWNLAR